MTLNPTNYDRWLTTPPWDAWPDPWELQHHCSACGCWLKALPDRVESKDKLIECKGPDEAVYGPPVAGWIYTPCETDCKGPHTFTEYEGTLLYFTCSHCGCTNIEMDY